MANFLQEAGQALMQADPRNYAIYQQSQREQAKYADELAQRQAIQNLPMDSANSGQYLAKLAQITGDPRYALAAAEQNSPENVITQQLKMAQLAQLLNPRPEYAVEKTEDGRIVAYNKLNPTNLQVIDNGPAGGGSKAYRDATAKQQAEVDVGNQSKVQAAQSFLARIAQLRDASNNLGTGGGPIEGSDTSRTIGNFIPFATGNESKRQLLEQAVANAELDVAQLKLKGQGAITDSERAIAKATLPSVKDNDLSTRNKKIDQLEQEAKAIISGGGVFGGSPASPQGTPSKIAIGPNGAKLGLINNQWVPIP